MTTQAEGWKTFHARDEATHEELRTALYYALGREKQLLMKEAKMEPIHTALESFVLDILEERLGNEVRFR